jgi:hypothetical protein
LITLRIFLKLRNNRSFLEPLLFVTYINDLPPTINALSEPTIFADDISVIISRTDSDYFCTMSNTVLSQISKWFTANKLALNLVRK